MILIQTTAVVILSFAVFGISGLKYKDLNVKYSTLIGGYWGMPVTVKEVNKQHKFVLAGHDSELNVDFYSYPDDPRLFLLFDTYGNIAGVRTGYIKSDLQNTANKNGLPLSYDYGQISMFKSAKVWNTDIWYASVLFVHPDKLMAGGRKDTKGIVAEGVYVILDGNWVHVAKSECDVEEQGFTKQGCFLGMGQHYFYKVSPSLDCKEFQPFFALYDNGELIGFGLVPFGSFTNKKGGQKWFENVPRTAVEVIVPHAPQCIYQWTDYYELTSLHFFLKDNARNTLCPLPLLNFNRCKK